MSGFYGNFTARIDNNGRVALPSKLRPVPRSEDESPASFILTMGLDGSLTFYPMEEWKSVQQQLDTLNFTEANYRNFTRQLYAAAVTVRPDKQGRMIIPPHLIEFADLSGEVLILGSNRWIEIWNPDKYKQYLRNFGQSYEEVAESLFPKKQAARQVIRFILR